MKLLYTLLLGFFFVPAIAQQRLQPFALTCEYKTNPSGIEVVKPRLSWKIKSSGKAVTQTAYNIRVGLSSGFQTRSIVWSTGKKITEESILQSYDGPALEPGKRYYWQVKVWDNQKNESSWSETAYFETGLPQDKWQARWIEPVQDTVPHSPALLVRREFNIKGNISKARVYVTSHGFYEFSINGKKAGDAVLTPGWTSYQSRLQYQVYDVTKHLVRGKNAMGAMLGDGWYRSSLGWVSNFGIYGKKLGLICQLEITYSDGTVEWIASGEGWKSTASGPITDNSIYDGETYDARKEINGWDRAGFDDSQWKPVPVVDYPKENLIAEESVPIRRIEEIKPVRIFRTPKGTLVADLGQNMVGWIRLKVKGSSGTTVKIRHAEVLDKFGEFYTANLRSAGATATYTLKGGEEEVYEPRFTFFGFRYVAVEGFPGELKPEHLTGVVVHSDMKPSGSFECSNPLINQLQHNIQWGQKGNFVDVPTDCPQRDERLGWTGDAQAFIRTAAYNMDVAPFFTKWLKDLSADQYKDGQVPFVIPDALRGNSGTSAGWGDVATIAPWTIYKVYGDKGILETQYESMKKYVDYISRKAGNTYLWKGGSVFGDWLFYKSMAQTENDGFTPPDMIATCFFAYSTQLLAKSASVLGKADDATYYETLAGKIKDAFNRHYVTAEGRVSAESQTGYVLALMFDLLPTSLREKAASYLVEDIKGRGNHLSTGFLGTPYLCHVLTANGRTDVAYDLLMQETFPSWLYPVKMGATTIWERWDGQKTDSTFQDVGMNSFNHYAYGAIGDWMYRVVAGIEIGEPGYKKILIQPQPGVSLTYAKAAYESMYGRIASGWEKKDGKIIITVSIPANTTATVRLPKATLSGVTESGVPLEKSIPGAKEDKGDLLFELGSGDYRFEYGYAN